ncbi:cell number regulator 2-like [Silene latifolia]|uniref:cell number regulator 2-like n=1 Tax=Silene latifolia TaxID=37657 RepID=UPI003D76C1C1
MATNNVDFSTDLFDCLSDPSLCCLTCFCPCITFGRIAEIVDKGSPSWVVSGALYSLILAFTGGRCQCVYSGAYRSKLKAQFGMEADIFEDFCTHFCCEPCALSQEYRELQHRGYDVVLGWHGNMERQNPGMMPPQIGGGMMR